MTVHPAVEAPGAPPADTPPADTPSAGAPPVDIPSVDAPPVASPPVDPPSAGAPVGESPLGGSPPVAAPPSWVPPDGPGSRADTPQPAGTTGRGRPGAQWASLAVLLVATAVAYLWDLSRSGYANSFYAAAVEAGTKSWKAFFFGSLDPSSFITVDKPPASLWVMELSGRLFGFSSWSLLAPQALEGVATVALVYATVRRWHGHRPALLAGAVMATTPVAALMFRFDNPDALLVLLMTAAAYAVTRAIEAGGTRWVVLAGTALGFAFLAKMGQAFLVVPGFALAYLVAAPSPLRRRILQLLAGLGALLVSAGWWVAIVALVPAADRPMIDGSRDNSILNLIFGYNGFSRVFGSGGPGGSAAPGGGGGSSFSGSTGLLRLFNDLMGAQASWLLPAAVAAVVVALVATRHAPRTDRTRAAVIVWGGWLLVTGAVFSFGQGVIHTYYTVALAPAIAALVGVGAAVLARHWNAWWARAVAAATVAGTAAWAVVLLDRAPGWNGWLQPLVIAAAVVAVAGLLAGPALRSGGARRLALVGGLAAAAVAGLAGPTAYALDTVATPHTGSIPSAGPTTAASIAGFPGGAGRLGGAGAGLPGFAGAPGALGAGSGTARTGTGELPTGAPAGPGGARGGVPSGGAFPGAGAGTGGPSGAGTAGSGTGSGARGVGSGSGLPSIGSGARPGAGGESRIPGPGGAAAGAAGPGGAGTVAKALVHALEADAGHYRWVAATDGSAEAASLELATGGDAVMAIGGFNGNGGLLSLARFEAYVKAGDIHYYVAAGGGGGGPGGAGGGTGGGNAESAIATWVADHYTATTIGGVTVYDLTGASK